MLIWFWHFRGDMGSGKWTTPCGVSYTRRSDYWSIGSKRCFLHTGSNSILFSVKIYIVFVFSSWLIDHLNFRHFCFLKPYYSTFNFNVPLHQIHTVEKGMIQNSEQPWAHSASRSQLHRRSRLHLNHMPIWTLLNVLYNFQQKTQFLMYIDRLVKPAITRLETWDNEKTQFSRTPKVCNLWLLVLQQILDTCFFLLFLWSYGRNWVPSVIKYAYEFGRSEKLEVEKNPDSSY